MRYLILLLFALTACTQVIAADKVLTPEDTDKAKKMEKTIYSIEAGLENIAPELSKLTAEDWKNQPFSKEETIQRLSNERSYVELKKKRYKDLTGKIYDKNTVNINLNK